MGVRGVQQRRRFGATQAHTRPAPQHWVSQATGRRAPPGLSPRPPTRFHACVYDLIACLQHAVEDGEADVLQLCRLEHLLARARVWVGWGVGGGGGAGLSTLPLVRASGWVGGGRGWGCRLEHLIARARALGAACGGGVVWCRAGRRGPARRCAVCSGQERRLGATTHSHPHPTCHPPHPPPTHPPTRDVELVLAALGLRGGAQLGAADVEVEGLEGGHLMGGERV